MDVTLEQSQTHKQVMSRTQIQYLKVLAMTNYELYEFLLSEAMDNPLLDVENMGQQFQIAQSRIGYEPEHVHSGEQQIVEIPDWRGNPLEESVEECLLLQLSVKKCADTLAVEIVSGYLQELGAGHYHKIGTKLGVSVGKIMEAANTIRQLDPRPLHLCGGNRTEYLIPDVIFQCTEAEFKKK